MELCKNDMFSLGGIVLSVLLMGARTDDGKSEIHTRPADGFSAGQVKEAK